MTSTKTNARRRATATRLLRKGMRGKALQKAYQAEHGCAASPNMLAGLRRELTANRYQPDTLAERTARAAELTEQGMTPTLIADQLRREYGTGISCQTLTDLRRAAGIKVRRRKKGKPASAPAQAAKAPAAPAAATPRPHDEAFKALTRAAEYLLKAAEHIALSR